LGPIFTICKGKGWGKTNVHMMMKGYICKKKVLVMIERHDKELKKNKRKKRRHKKLLGKRVKS
jgi:hypothetical protein